MSSSATDAEEVEGRSLRVEPARKRKEADEGGGEAGEDGTGLVGEQESGGLDPGVDVVGLVLQVSELVRFRTDEDRART